MKRRDLVRPSIFFLASFGLTLAVLASVRSVTTPATASSSVASTSPRLEASSYEEVAGAFRRGDFEIVEAELLEQIERGSIEARVLLGLYAHVSERNALALEHLGNAEDYEGELEDWRLWALASSADILGQKTLSRAVLLRLVEEHPVSPVRAPAVELLAQQAVARSDWLGVFTLIETAYESFRDGETRDRLARLQWEAGQALKDPEISRAAARRLLVDHPLSASDLDVVAVFRAEDGGLAWSSFLSPADIIRRSQSLLSAGLPESALETLAETPEFARDLDWYLVSAQALTDSRDGEAALSALEPLHPEATTDRNRVEWARASAALELATPRKGRGHITTEQRRKMRAQAHIHLDNVASGEDRVLATKALRILFADLLEDERFEEAVARLKRLAEIDPYDTTGARPLWGLGWKAYEERNYSGAIGYWTVLSELYPQSNYNRGGLYWSARGHEMLGNSERARELLHSVVDVEFTDIYRRHALARLDATPPGATEESASEPWPRDARLARAEKLRSLGLDEAALVEIAAHDETVDRRPLEALRALVLADKGERRQSIISLRRAFPILGTPHQSLAPLEARHLYYPLDFQQIIEEQARARALPSHLVFGLIRQESAFDTRARSWAGAQGLMQIMPATGRELARRLGLRYSHERLSDPEFSIRLGTSYLSQVLEMFEGDEVLALAGYNAGPYRIKRLWRQAGNDREIDRFLEELSYSETRNYVKRVLLYSDSYRRLYEPAS